MNSSDDLDRQLRAIFVATAPEREPDGLFESVMSLTASLDQRRPLMVRARELAELPTVRWPAFRATLIALGTIVILLLAFGAALFIGSRLPDPPSIVHGEFSLTGPLTVDVGREIRVMSSAALPNGRILVVGTSLTRTSGSFSDRPWAAIYEPTTGTFTETGAPTIIRPISTLTALADGRVLLAGGFLDPEMFEDPDQAALADPASAEVWDPASGRFERTGQMLVGRYGHTATLLRDGRVLLTGGDTEEIEATAELYDPTSGLFQAVGRMIEPERIYAAAAELADGRILVAGGFTGGSLSSGAELYDPSSQTFSAAGPMAIGRAEHTATTLPDGRVLVAGGARLSSAGALDGDATPTAELFDPATGTFEAVGPMTTERALHAAVRVGERVLIVGGQNIDGPPRTAELFDPATSSFLAAGRAPTGDYDTAASILPDGHVLVTAGGAAPVLWEAAEITAGDPGGRAPAGPGFSAVEWPALRDRQTATALADGRVLIAGGRDSRSGERSAAAELFDPTTGATTAIRMQLAHSDHAAVRLMDGRVLIVGGPEPAELFDPATATFETTDAPPFPSLAGGSGPPTSDSTHALVLADGRVLVLGHARSGQAWNRQGRAAAIYDPVTEMFVAAPAVFCEASLAPVRMSDDRVFVPCGPGTIQALVLDPTTATFETTDAPPFPSLGPGSGPPTSDSTHALVLADGRVLVLGRARSGQAWNRQGRAAAIYDPVTEVFVAAPAVPCEASLAPLRMSDDRVFVPCGPGTNEAIVLDPTGAMPTAIPGSAGWTNAAPLASGGVLVTSDSGQAAVFDPQSRTFVPSQSSPMAREGAVARQLTDGRVLIVGGRSDLGDPLRFAELYDPSTGLFVDVGPMVDGRLGLTVEELADGRVLIVGGSHQSPDRTDPPASGAEVFDPARVPLTTTN